MNNNPPATTSGERPPALIVRQASEEPPGVMRVAPGLPLALGEAIDRWSVITSSSWSPSCSKK